MLNSINLVSEVVQSLKAQAETIISNEQVCFTAERRSTEQIFNLPANPQRKYLQHQQDLYRVFIDFKMKLNGQLRESS